MKCKNCPAQRVDGYEYLETYCLIESISAEYETEDGCSLNHNKIKRLVKESEIAFRKYCRG